MTEIPLTGGRTTPGVVRIGDTVRRPQVMTSDFVHRLLHNLEDAGFENAPRSLGRAEEGRDVLGWIEGEVPLELSAAHGDALLAAAARLICHYHDATASLPTVPAAVAAGLEVVCHNDLSPCNFVFRGGMPAAIIDFDAAAPGTRAYDLGYAAWLWLDLGNMDMTITEQRRRLRVFLDGYGPEPARPDVVAAILERQRLLGVQGRRNGDAAVTRWAERCRLWTSDGVGDGVLS